MLTQQEKNAYKEWLEGVRVKLPDLANRVFALRKNPYNGFHYALEATLGKVILFVNSSHEFPKDIHDILLHEVVFEDLVKDIVKGEQTIAKNN